MTKKYTRFAAFTLLITCAIAIPVLYLKADLARHVEGFNARVIGDKVDSLHGVYVYYNGSVSHVGGRNVAKDGYNLGLKYQCVEFVKRYYYEYYKHKMPDSYGHAKDFFNAALKDGAYNAKRDLYQYRFPSSTRPQIGDLLIFDGNLFNPYGHVAIVSCINKSEIEIIQQNPGPTAPSREWIGLALSPNGWVLDRADALGWLRKKD